MRGGLTPLAACLALAALAAGCGGGESSTPPPQASTRTAASAPAQTHTQTTQAEEPPPDLVHGVAPNPWREPLQRDLRPHPHFRLDRTIVRELKKGHGPAVRAHDSVYVDYIQADYGTGVKFYRSWGSGPYGTAGVILTPIERWRGMLAGMRGMRPGGRRKILTPPRLGGIWPRHADYGNVIYWDVVLRKIFGRGCDREGRHCRPVSPASAPSRPRLAPLRWRQPRVTAHPHYDVDRVVVRDIARGTGPAVGPHDYVLMDYVESDYTRGLPIYDAWHQPGPVAGVILAPIERWRGLTIGMRGMRVGGRRQILVPPRLGGIEPRHADWSTWLAWDVALRGIYARGCADDGEPCRSRSGP